MGGTNADSAPAEAVEPPASHPWRDDRWSAALIMVGTVAYGIAWHWTTRPMGDSASYRLAGTVLSTGWDRLTDRTMGYPLLLWATGSLQHETHALFVAQAVLHAVSVWMVVRLLGRSGIVERWRVVAVVMLFVPPTMVNTVTSGSEVLSEFLLVLLVACLTTWTASRRVGLLLAAGTALGASVWVRPSYVALIVPVTVFAAWPVGEHADVRAAGRRAIGWRAAAGVAMPAIVLSGVLLVVNAARFEYAGFTPLTGWYLGSRTSAFVETLPAADAPARRVLVEERDRQRLLGDAVDAPNYSFAVRRQLEDATGLTGRRLDDYMLRLNAGLIVRHPFEYADAVTAAIPRFAEIESRPEVTVWGRGTTHVLMLVHMALLMAFLSVMALFAGVAWSVGVPRPAGRLVALVAGITGAVLAVSVLFETGASRLRSPLDPLLVLAFMVAGSTVARSRRSRPALDDVEA